MERKIWCDFSKYTHTTWALVTCAWAARELSTCTRIPSPASMDPYPGKAKVPSKRAGTNFASTKLKTKNPVLVQYLAPRPRSTEVGPEALVLVLESSKPRPRSTKVPGARAGVPSAWAQVHPCCPGMPVLMPGPQWLGPSPQWSSSAPSRLGSGPLVAET